MGHRTGSLESLIVETLKWKGTPVDDCVAGFVGSSTRGSGFPMRCTLQQKCL